MEVVREEPIVKAETVGWKGLWNRFLAFTVVDTLVILIPIVCGLVWLRQFRALRAKLKRS